MFSRLFLAGLVLVGSLVGAQASTVLDVSGPVSASSPSVFAGGVVGGVLSVGDVSDAAITLDLTCFSCVDGQLFLTDSFGPGTDFSNVLATTTFDGSFTNVANVGFSGLTLTAGDLFVIASISSGGLVLGTTDTPTVTAEAGFSALGALIAPTPNTTTPFASSFNLIDDTSLLVSMTGTLPSGGNGGTGPSDPVPPVPLPASWGLLAVGLGTIVAARRRRLV